MSRFAEPQVQIAAAGLWLGGMAILDGLARAEDARRVAGWRAFYANRERNAAAAREAVAAAQEQAEQIERCSRVERALFLARRRAQTVRAG